MRSEDQNEPQPAEPAEEQPTAAAEPEQGSAETAPSGADADALRDRYLRLAAEFDNYRKRTERERAESWVRAQARLVERLLDPLDDLQRVAHYSAESTTVDALLEGVQMVERKLLRALESEGLAPLDAEGKPFDPTVHEAITTVETDRREEDDVVADVFQKGYQFKEVLLRPARVRVKKFHG